MRPYILSELNWDYLKDAEYDLAVLPWGAIEAHNFHLPYSTDVVESDFITAESARIAWEKGARVIVLPTVPFGVNTGQKDIFLNLNINPSTQYAILKDILEVLNRQGVLKLVVFNSHGGNDFKPMIRELGSMYPGMFICIANWIRALDINRYFDNPGDHAGELETSLMLLLKPEMVLPRNKWGEGREKKNRIRDFTEGWVWSERQWSKITEDTGVGTPAASSNEKGRRYFDDLTVKIGDFFFELSTTDIKNLYV